MKAIEVIEAEREWLEPLIGAQRASWYEEACQVDLHAHSGELMWACRYREMAMEAGHLEERLAKLGASTADLLQEKPT
jgi:hypothetical protein